jgi:branched-chain amino acid aminotransferase
VDRIVIGDGAMGPITTALHKAYFDILHGLAPDRYNWLTPVKVREAVAA